MSHPTLSKLMVTEKLNKFIQGCRESLIKEKILCNVIGQVELLFSHYKFPLEN